MTLRMRAGPVKGGRKSRVETSSLSDQFPDAVDPRKDPHPAQLRAVVLAVIRDETDDATEFGGVFLHSTKKGIGLFRITDEEEPLIRRPSRAAILGRLAREPHHPASPDFPEQKKEKGHDED